MMNLTIEQIANYAIWAVLVSAVTAIFAKRTIKDVKSVGAETHVVDLLRSQIDAMHEDLKTLRQENTEMHAEMTALRKENAEMHAELVALRAELRGRK